METDDVKTKERPEKVSFHIEIVKDEFILPMMAGNLKVEQELEDVLINIVNVKEEVEDEVIPMKRKISDSKDQRAQNCIKVKKKSNAEKCKDYRERKKLKKNQEKEQHETESISQKAAAQKRKNADYMISYRRKQKLAKDNEIKNCLQDSLGQNLKKNEEKMFEDAIEKKKKKAEYMKLYRKKQKLKKINEHQNILQDSSKDIKKGTDRSKKFRDHQKVKSASSNLTPEDLKVLKIKSVDNKIKNSAAQRSCRQNKNLNKTKKTSDTLANASLNLPTKDSGVMLNTVQTAVVVEAITPVTNISESISLTSNVVQPRFSKNTYGAPKFIPLKHFKYIPAKNHSIALVRDSVSR